MSPNTPERTVERLGQYRRLLASKSADSAPSVFSHELAGSTGVTAAQVRRDMMTIGFSGSPTRGYNVELLGQAIARILDPPQAQEIALVGVGNLGRAILAYFVGRRPQLALTVAFDTDAERYNRVIHGCRCYPATEMEALIQGRGIHTAILAVPAASAQAVAERIITAGVTGILNFAPVRLHVPDWVFVESMDLALSLEKVAFFGRQQTKPQG
jgi:redox-sensing transcriptional repressor